MTMACQDKALENVFCISSVNSDHQNKHGANSPHCMFSQSQHGRGGGAELRRIAGPLSMLY